MLSIDEIKELVAVAEKSSLSKIKLECQEYSLTLEKAAAPTTPTVVPTAPVVVLPEAPAEKPVELDQFMEITSPMVGTFYLTPDPDSEPFVKVGTKVTPDMVVCILEAMKLFTEIEADCSGEIVEILAKSGEFVEFGQPLFKVKIC